MQSLEHGVLAQTAWTQFKELQQSMARFHPSDRLPISYYLSDNTVRIDLASKF